MKGLLDLSHKKRQAPGLTPNSPFESLHGHRVHATQAPPVLSQEEVNAAPKSSSDEDSEVENGREVVVVSESPPHKAVKSESKRSGTRDLRERAGANSSKKEAVTTDADSSKHPATIPRETFVPSDKPQRFNGSQKDQQKGKDFTQIDDDPFEMLASPRKKARLSQGYGKSSQSNRLENPHLKPSEGSKSHVKKTSASIKVSSDGFKSISDDTLSRSRRASQTFLNGNQVSSQPTPKKAFRMPPKISPKKPPKFKTLGIYNQQGGTGRMTRSSATETKQCVPTVLGAVDKEAVSNAVSVITEKLGLQIKPPLSSNTTSSMPSVSVDNTNGSSPLSSAPSEMEPIDNDPIQKNLEYIRNAAHLFSDGDTVIRCPFCKEEVDKLFLEEWAGGRRLTIRQQAEFCKAYKKHKAETEWRTQGFPIIEWQSLDGRLNKYHAVIDEILQRGRLSFYRNVFEDTMSNGKDRGMRKAFMDGDSFGETNPGYYGSRGARIMYDPSHPKMYVFAEH